ncbi:MAG: CDP-glycerol glycerophosphotransferase family protein [Eubacterium sp.]|nr:CDP-glycerol glycerophosphotransferase family protein [Eubacterium sp.]
MIKKIGYYIFSLFFHLYRLWPVNSNKIFLVASHDQGPEGNIGLMKEWIEGKKENCKFVYLTREDGINHPLRFFGKLAFDLATSSVIFLDNSFMPMAYTPFAKGVKVVQLWHGTGTIKKFGLDAEEEEVCQVAKKGNQRITHLIVNGPRTKDQYQTAFGLAEERIFQEGLPRTDLILDRDRMGQLEEKFYREYPEYREKKILLYAPTFRDSQVEDPRLALDLEKFVKKMNEDQVLFLRLHPHVADNFKEPVEELYGGRVVNMSAYPGVASLLQVADCLITDYSSIMFEFYLLKKPVFFFAYDLAEFEKEGRSFYEDYRQFVPGPVCLNQEELVEAMEDYKWDEARWQAFCQDNYKYLDTGARDRVFSLIFK